jgi:hypothetical protein
VRRKSEGMNAEDVLNEFREAGALWEGSIPPELAKIPAVKPGTRQKAVGTR